VALSDRLAETMRGWLAAGPPGDGLVFATAAGGRLTSPNCCKALARHVRGSRWRVLRGFHVLRHSLASNLAAAGTDQRVIDEIMGHQTEAMRKRYRHFTPAARAGALHRLFGG
jgi:integrase